LTKTTGTFLPAFLPVFARSYGPHGTWLCLCLLLLLLLWLLLWLRRRICKYWYPEALPLLGQRLSSLRIG
jgi:hypothetical protein